MSHALSKRKGTIPSIDKFICTTVKPPTLNGSVFYIFPASGAKTNITLKKKTHTKQKRKEKKKELNKKYSQRDCHVLTKLFIRRCGVGECDSTVGCPSHTGCKAQRELIKDTDAAFGLVMSESENGCEPPMAG